MTDAAAHMNSIYRFQRHIYDVTRKPYLLGRDVLIDELVPPIGGTVLEVGCGTARNLLKIAERYRSARCFGLDVSSEMIKSARRSIDGSGDRERVVVALADACSFDALRIFGVELFDRVVISYALSMIPQWRDVLESALALVASGGQLHVVDFGDQHGLPAVFRGPLNMWLGAFSVSPRADLAACLNSLARSNRSSCAVRQLYRGYAVAGIVRKP